MCQGGIHTRVFLQYDCWWWGPVKNEQYLKRYYLPGADLHQGGKLLVSLVFQFLEKKESRQAVSVVFAISGRAGRASVFKNRRENSKD